MRHRTFFLLGVGAICAGISWLSDPDQGMSTALGLLAIAQGVWAIGAAHWARKALMDYPQADMRGLFGKAGEHPIGAGLALLSIAIVFVGLLTVFAPRAHADTLPAGWGQYGSMLKREQAARWPEHPQAHYLAALVEQESCISLRHSKCWNPGARLKTDREEGAGVGQITRAYRPDGSVRFDALADLTRKYSADLAGLSWGTVYQRPDLQFRALVLMARDAAQPFRTADGWLHFGDAAYNGGPRGVALERRACAMTAGCNPALWFGHVERHCLKSRQPLYGGRSACDINREHVRNVFQVRAEKYSTAWRLL